VSTLTAPAATPAVARKAAAGPMRPVRILLIGEEHARGKVARHYALLEELHGIETHYFLDDRSGITRLLAQSMPLRVTYGPDPSAGYGNVLRYWAAFRRCLDEVRPDVLEVYTSINPKVLLPMLMYAAARGVPRVVVCRGELWPPVFAIYSPLQRWLFARMLRMSQLVVPKELYMGEQLDRLAPNVPRLFWGNAIPVKAEPGYDRQGNEVLFLNFFKPWRNLDVVVRAARLVAERVPGVRFRLVGGTDRLAETGTFYADLNEYERGIVELIEALGLTGTVEVLPFTHEVDGYFAAAKAYVLPADLVFCNYALLEAMERGVPPIVSADRDPEARRIVEDGVSGLVVALDAQAFADAIVALLQDEPRRQALARGARATVVERFNLQRSLQTLADAYTALAGGRHPIAAAE
jgi:glycosyltransferase involved in cell wall biosynthesis